MKKSLKKSIAILLMTVLMFSQFSIAFANEGSEKVAEEQGKEISKIVEVMESKIQQVNEADIVPGKVLVKYRDDISALAKSTAAYQVSAASIKNYEEIGISSLEISKEVNVLEVVEELKKNPAIEYAEPVYVVRSFETTVSDEVYSNDEYLLNGWQWGLEAVNVNGLWQEITEEEMKKVTIAILDSGVDLDHEDLKDSIVGGYDFINNDDMADDDRGHGTHVAGIAAAIRNNSKGIAGVAGGSKIMPVKVLDENGEGSTETVVKGINYAVENGADIINLSLGTYYRSMAVEDAINNALVKDIVVVAAVGNEYSRLVSYPAAFDGVIGVGAIDYYVDAIKRASYSNRGLEVDVAAPGNDILSTIPMNQDSSIGINGYDLKHGTSMASPFVAGLAALIRANEPSLSYSEIEDKIKNNAVDLGDLGKDDSYGYGLINGDDSSEALPPYEFNELYFYMYGWDYAEESSILSVNLRANSSKGTVNEEVYGSFSLMMREYQINENDSKEWIDEPQELTVIDMVYGRGNTSLEFSKTDNCVLYVEGKDNYFNSNMRYFENSSISGTISLPEGEVAPEGGLDVKIDLNYTIDDLFDFDHSKILNQLTIPEGENSIQYKIIFPFIGHYRIEYTISEYDDIKGQYVTKGYYNSNGTTALSFNAEMILLGKEDLDGIYIEIINTEDMKDDYGNNISTAKTMNIGDRIEGETNYTADVDYFKFEVENPGIYKIYTEGPSDTDGILFDENEESIVRSYYSHSRNDWNFLITEELSKGIYYIEVSGNEWSIGKYTLIVESGEDDYGDSLDNAGAISLNQFIYGMISDSDDIDVFEFKIDEEGTYKISAMGDTFAGGADINGVLYDEDENIIHSETEGFYMFQELSKGTYYLEVQGYDEYEKGEYRVLVERQDIKIDDPNLEKAVREAIDNSDYGYWHIYTAESSSEDSYSGGSGGSSGDSSDIYKDDVEKITKLIANDKEISSLGGIEYLINLQELSLSGNNITDITPIGQLEDLYHLKLDNNSISNINPLSSMNQLTDLSLAQNQISDISSLRGLEHLSYLRISNNNINNISPLSGLSNLQYLYLVDNNITNYEALGAYYASLAGKDFLTASGVTISGTPKVDNTLTGQYEFNALDEGAQNHSAYRWLSSDSRNGTYTAIAGANGTTYKLKESEDGKYIKFEVTPKTAEEEGIAVRSNAVGPITGEAPSGGGGGGGGGGGLPADEKETIERETGTITLVDEDDKKQAKIDVDEDILKDILKNQAGTSAVIDVKTGENVDVVEVEMEADIISTANENSKSLVVETDRVSFKIEPGTLDIGSSNDKISLSATKLSYDEIKDELPKTEGESVSLVYDFNLSIGEKKITSFNKPMTITIDIDTSKIEDKDKVGVYYFNETDNQWEYLGGKVDEDGTITFTVHHFSAYTAMEYNKTFEDIVDHWAKEDIEKMASRHIAKGITEDKFAPKESITRAEFAALLIRALEIKENPDSVDFKDIAEDAWYKEVVSKAYGAGIVSGTEDNKFEPNNTITREQMATMIMRAYQHASGTRLGDIITTMEIRFNDEAAASNWARRNIILSNAKGFMRGFPDGSFRPKENATRAQAIFVIKKLLVELDVISE